MLDIVTRIKELVRNQNKFAIATVVRTWRSSPRPVGSSLIVTADGEMAGSVSGGCVENAVVAKALKVLATGKAELAEFGVADEEAWEVGLSCGGALSVFIQPFFPQEIGEEVIEAIEANKGTVLLTQIDEEAKSFIVDPENRDQPTAVNGAVLESGLTLYSQRKHGIIEEGGNAYFQFSFNPKLQMLLIGSAHITTEMITLAKLHDFETIVIDPRDTFAKKTHYEVRPDKVHVQWPQEVLSAFALAKDTYAVILSHDPKIDDEALKILLASKVAYIGALGSRKTQAKRVERLKAYGFDEHAIERIKAPIGIDIGSQTPKEIALSIMAEIISVKNQQ